MKLTAKQKEIIFKATKDNDFCAMSCKRTMKSLVDKGIFKYAEGFGYKYGSIIELTEEGKKIQKQLKNKKL